MPIDADRIVRFCPGVKPEIAQGLASSLQSHGAGYGVADLLTEAHFMGQMAHESGGFSHFEENLNYSADRIRQVWPRLAARADALAHNPQALANAAYANKIGNGDEASGDGYRFRGRGIVQITGRANYKDMGGRIGVDLIAAPDQAAVPETAALVALAFWKTKGCTAPAERDDCPGVTRLINGPALAGLEDRRARTEKAKTIFA